LAAKGTYTINLKYDPAGNRVYKSSSTQGTRRYIVDISGGLPTILLEIDPADSLIKKSYFYANGEVLMQYNGNHTADKYFYLHDRLGSVRGVIDSNATVVKYYTFDAFGKTLEEGGTLTNPFMFVGQYYDSEIGQYYLRARQYDPQLMRFTGKDSVDGQFEDPMTLHKYLYCLNNPINGIDPQGLWTIHVMLSGIFSFGPSLMYQKGIVLDDKGNVGWITTSNDPHPIEGIGDWGLGLGTPAVGAGVAVGLTNADTIFDLQGAGTSVGGSVGRPGWGLSIGVDYLKGVQRNGEYYNGFEVTPGVGKAGLAGLEAHGHATWTTVSPWESNQQEGLDIVRESIENSMFDAQTTLGQSEALLGIWSELP